MIGKQQEEFKISDNRNLICNGLRQCVSKCDEKIKAEETGRCKGQMRERDIP